MQVVNRSELQSFNFMMLEIVRLTHLTRLRTISVFPYSTGIELVFQHKLLKSLWSKNAVKMMHGTTNLDIKIFGSGLRNLQAVAVSAAELDVTENQELAPKTI